MKNQNELPAHRQGEDGDRRAEDSTCIWLG